MKITKNLSIHEEVQVGSDILLHVDLYKDEFHAGDLVRVIQSIEGQQPKEIILKLPDPSVVQNNSNFQISLSKRVASNYEFVPRRPVSIERVDDIECLEVDTLLLTFRDQYIGRADMYHIKLSLIGEFIFSSMKMSFGSIHLDVKEMKASDEQIMKYGTITENTKIAFRSRSAKMFIFLQMSSEMWEFAEDSNLYFERSVNKFLTELFGRWKKLQTNHSVTIVLFSRVFYTKEEVAELKNSNNSFQNLPLRSVDDKYYRDFYKVVVDNETRSDWPSVIKILKNEFLEYPSIIQWQPPLIRAHQVENENKLYSIGRNSFAHEGNFLEAINLALNEFSKHYIDRDLKHTGQMIIVLSPGSGYFKVSRPLEDLTKQKIIDNGIGCDLICMARPPLHGVPLFHFEEEAKSRNTGQHFPFPKDPSHILSFVDGNDIYKFPFWIYISFYGSNNAKNDVLVAKLLESIYGWKESFSIDNGDANEVQVPIARLRGSFNSWVPSNQSNSSIQREEESKFAALPKDTWNTPYVQSPVLVVRPPAQPISFEGTPSDRVHKFSYDSSGSISSFTEHNLSVGSFTPANEFLSKPPVLQPVTRTITQATVNPFDLSIVLTDTSSSRRWSHMYPRVNDRTKNQRNISAPNLFTSEANWRSIAEPVCLPLGTDYMPTKADLNKNYLQGAYNLSLFPGEDVYHNKMEDLLQELVSQRLAQNFQIVCSPESQKPSRRHRVLALGNIFHELSYDEFAQNITVKRYHLKQREPNRSFKYHYALWPVNYRSFMSSGIAFHHTEESTVNWNAVDQLISGEEQNFSPNLRLWQIQFVLLPGEDILPPSDSPMSLEQAKDLEERQLTAFANFKKNLFRSRVFKGEIDLEIEIFTEFNHRSSLSSKSLGDIGTPSGTSLNTSTSSGEQDLEELVARMRHPKSGLDIRTRRRLTFKTQRRCFIGKELVDWILRNADLPSYEREAAISLANQLYQRGLLKSVSNNRPFEDGNGYYRFTEDQNLLNIRNDSLRQKKQKPITPSANIAVKRSLSSGIKPEIPPSLFDIKHHSMEYHKSAPISLEETLPTSGSPKLRSLNTISFASYIQTNKSKSRKIVVEDRGKNSDRYQWIVFEYDEQYHPNSCYHMGIQWMICTGSVIQEIIAQFERHAKNAGVSLIQVPVTRDQADLSFRAPVIITVPLEVDKHSLLSRFGFIPDKKVGEHFEYMHRTGVAFIQCSDQGFIWKYNYTPALHHQMHKAASLLKELEDVCEDLMADSDDEDDDAVTLFLEDTESQ